MSRRRASLGAAGEQFADWWLTNQGLAVLARNVSVKGGEIDILARDGRQKVVVEVRTVTGEGDPIDAVDHSKRSRVTSLAASLGANRVDYLGIGLRSWGVEVHWVPG